jgi:7,8-dihydropterin-6-yl-methyl-4-(beta-D-ribofuranosyl)aminobenzene 5'-phosphate synthase
MLLMGQGGGIAPDSLEHELVMVVRETDGLAVFTGCGHNGVLNMVDAVRAGIPGTSVLAEDEASVRQIGRMLLDRRISRIYTGHCTGAKAFRALKDVMGSAVDCLATGSRIEI